MAGDAAATQGQGADQGGEAQQGGPDIGALSEQLATLSGGMEDMRNFLQSQPWQPADDGQQQQEPEADPFDLSFLDPQDPGYDPEQIASSLQDVVERAVEQRVQQHVQPLAQQQQQLAERQQEAAREREAEALVTEFPALGDTETANQLVHVAGQVAEAYGHPELANEPWFWRTIYMAGQAADMAREEGDAPRPAVLEGGGGAMPSGAEGDLGDAIIGANKGRGVLPFG